MVSNTQRARIRTHEELIAKFVSRVQMPDDPNGCWIWKRSRTPRHYGGFYDSVQRLPMSAYRFAYQTFIGQVPDGLVLDHTCCAPACVNPAHLEPVTVSENLRRSYAQRRAEREERETAREKAPAAQEAESGSYAWLNAKVAWSVSELAAEYGRARGVAISHDAVARWMRRLHEENATYAENHGGTIGWRARREALILFFTAGKHLRQF